MCVCVQYSVCNVCVCVCVCVCLCVRAYVHMYVRMYIWMYACMYVREVEILCVCVMCRWRYGMYSLCESCASFRS